MKKILALLLSSTMLLHLAACGTSSETSPGGTATNQSTSATYADTLFDDSYVHTIDITIDEANWQDLVTNPTAKTKYAVDVTIDGNTIENVSFATRGNTSLSSVASSDSDRYSFKITFDRYEDNQTYNGLDKLNLQNIYADTTYMKDYLAFAIMEEAGVNAPLTSYTTLSINGELFGLYLALEDLDESFLERNYGEDYGDLYKPETEQLGNIGNTGDRENMQRPTTDQADISQATQPTEQSNMTEMPEGFTPPENTKMPEGFTPPENMEMPEGMQIPESMDFQNRNGNMFSMGANGADLVYTDDNFDSYSDIFDNAQTNPDDDAKTRMVQALEQLSTGTDLESCVDVDAVLRYFVAHNFVVNGDSYTGTMLHNYGLYEQDGILSMLPWDYNLAFGAFSGMGGSSNDATSIVNQAIDTPLTSGTNESRPMWGNLIQNEEYLSLYHDYFDELISDYFESGRFEAEVTRVYEMIRPYVENDPSAWYTVDEFDVAVQTITDFCLLRAQSVRGQLDGTIPSTTDGQNADSSALIDASSITISDMGTQNMGMGGNRENRQP